MTVVVVVAFLAACGRDSGGAAGAPVPDGELRIAAQFAPRSGYAIETDDAFILTQLGAAESLTSAAADGRCVRGSRRRGSRSIRSRGGSCCGPG
ncbi:hypothetical protein BJF90_12505 [Pseudonocardia sp. CNS-004]|nr:hypothetical protein BJF90_12505 [Pseudonocardia sp. CNS-004]